MKHNLIFGCFWRTEKLLLLNKNAKYIFIVAEMRKQDMKFYFIDYNYKFNVPQERNNKFATMNRIKCLKPPVSVQSN